MRAVLEQFLQDNPGVPGIVAHRIAADGSPAGQAAGIADPRTGRPLTPDATFRLASNTKTFAAATALRMVERGRLALDAPIAGFLPAELVERLLVIDGTSHGAEVTVRHLLTHCSGVPSLEDAGFIRQLIAEPDHVWTPWEKVEASLLERPTGLPGEVVIYSDTGYVLLALVLEQAGGQPLAALYRELLRFGALGLQTVYLEKLEPVPSGSGPRLRHQVNGADVSDIDATCDLWGGGGLVCDARDLAGFWRALFGGQVFDRAGTLAEMCVTRPEPSTGRQLGMGVFRGEAAGGEMWFHTGAWGSFAVHHPGTKVTVAGAMTESRNVDRSLVTRLYQRLLDELSSSTSGLLTNPDEGVFLFKGLSHFAFTVSDIDASVHWYEMILGLRLVARQRQDNAYTRQMVGFEDAVLEVAEFELDPAHAGLTLELIQYVRPPGGRPSLATTNVGVAHLSFVVGDIGAEYQRLAGAGVEFVSPPVDISEGMNQGGRACYFKDPDGITLELYQPAAVTGTGR